MLHQVEEKTSVIQRLKELAFINKDTLWVVVIYSISVNILSLIIPIAAQALVNIVSFGTLLQPVVVLTGIVFVMLGSAAILRIFQKQIVENIQQRIFTSVAINIAKILPKVITASFNQSRGVELVNRFFEVIVIQKSISILLITGLEIVLQSILSMILLAVYHPMLLAFDLCLIIALFLAVALPWKEALKTAVAECTQKHEVASWLEELVYNQILFKLHHNDQFALQKTDYKVSNYLQARQKHFKYILAHLYSIYGIYVISSSILLGLGGYLVMNQQLTLGQLVAAEIVLSNLVSGFVKFGSYLENIYDLFASTIKLGTLYDLPLETNPPLKPEQIQNLESGLRKPPMIEAENLGFNSSAAQIPVFENINFNIQPGQSLAIIGEKGSGKSVLVDLLMGFIAPSEGSIRINQIDLKEYSFSVLRGHLALVRGIEIFTGTILENLVLHRNSISLERIQDLLVQFKLVESFAKLPLGLHTQLSTIQNHLSTIELQKMMFIRSLLAEPQILIVDGALDSMSRTDIDTVIQNLKNYPKPFTWVVTTRREDIVKQFKDHLRLST